MITNYMASENERSYQALDSLPEVKNGCYRLRFTIFVQDMYNEQIYQMVKVYIRKYYNNHFKLHDAQNHFYAAKFAKKREFKNFEDRVPILKKRIREDSQNPEEAPIKRQRASEKILENSFLKYTDPYTLKSY